MNINWRLAWSIAAGVVIGTFAVGAAAVLLGGRR